jgi:hypothetical protein
MIMNINVLWLEDKHEEMPLVKAQFHSEGINVSCFKSSNAALSELRSNNLNYDALLCDIQILRDDNDIVESNVNAIHFKEELDKMNLHFDPVYFTGQTSHNRPDMMVLQEYLKDYEVYYKYEGDGAQQVIAALKRKAKKSEHFKLRNRFPSTYRAVLELGIAEFCVIPFVKFIDKGQIENSSFNLIRQCQELMVENLVLNGYLPRDVFQNVNQMNDAIAFMGGKNTHSENGDEFAIPDQYKVNKNVVFWMRTVRRITSLGSHAPERNYGLLDIIENGSDLSNLGLAVISLMEEIFCYFLSWKEKLKPYYDATAINRLENSRDKIIVITRVLDNSQGKTYCWAKNCWGESFRIPPNVYQQSMTVGSEWVVSAFQENENDYPPVVVRLRPNPSNNG